MTDEVKTCPICNREMEDRRHVGVECGYAVNEFVPWAEQILHFVECDEEGAYWGYTRRYPAGTRDEFNVGKVEERDGYTYTKVDTEQHPIDKIRLYEKMVYSVECCKACRADFLAIFGRWARGEYISHEGYGDIPVRIGGTIKRLTPEEYEEYKKEREAERDD